MRVNSTTIGLQTNESLNKTHFFLHLRKHKQLHISWEEHLNLERREK